MTLRSQIVAMGFVSICAYFVYFQGVKAGDAVSNTGGCNTIVQGSNNILSLSGGCSEHPQSAKQDELNAVLKAVGMGRFKFGEVLKDAPSSGTNVNLADEHLSGNFVAFQYRWADAPEESFGWLRVEALVNPASGVLKAVHISHARYNATKLTGLLKPFLSRLAIGINATLYFTEDIDRRRVELKHTFDEPPYVFTWETSQFVRKSNVMFADNVELTYSESVYTGSCVSQCVQEGGAGNEFYHSDEPTSPIPYNPKCDDGKKRSLTCPGADSLEEIWMVAR